MGNCSGKQSRKYREEPYTSSKKDADLEKQTVTVKSPDLVNSVQKEIETEESISELKGIETEEKGDPVVKKQETEEKGDPVVKKQDTEEKGNPEVKNQETEEKGGPVVKKQETEEKGNPEVKNQETEEKGNPEEKEANTERKLKKEQDEKLKTDNQIVTQQNGQESLPGDRVVIVNSGGNGDKNEKGFSYIGEKGSAKQDVQVGKLTGNQNSNNQSVAMETSGTKRKSRPWEFAHGLCGEDVETEFIDKKKNQSKKMMEDTRDDTKGRDDPTNNTENQCGDEKTNGPPSPGINRPETDSKPNCNLSHKLGVQQQHQENEKKPGLQQPPGDNNGYNRSHFAEPDRGQRNSHDELPSHQKRDKSKKDKKKQKKKDDLSGFPSIKDLMKTLPQSANINLSLHKDAEMVCIGNVQVNKKKVIKEIPVSKGEIQQTGRMKFKVTSVLNKASESVGYLHGKRKTGTCWRVGIDKIITAFHVVRDNIWHSVYNTVYEQDLKDIYVQFNYIEKENPRIVFKVEERILFADENLDVVVLQLKKKDENPIYPPPIDRFIRLDHDRHSDEKIYLIGHDKGMEKELNFGIGLWKPTETKMKELEEVCVKFGKENGYLGLDKKERLVIKCQFEGGASGSPGFVINNNNEAEVAFIYLRGFPSFYYEEQFSEADKRNFPAKYNLQQGVNIFSLYDVMKKKSVHLDLMNEIFSREHEKEKKEMNLPQHRYAIAGDGRNVIKSYLLNDNSTQAIENKNIDNQQVHSDLELSQGENQSFNQPGGEHQDSRLQPQGENIFKGSALQPLSENHEIACQPLGEGREGPLQSESENHFKRQTSQCLPSGNRKEFPLTTVHPKDRLTTEPPHIASNSGTHESAPFDLSHGLECLPDVTLGKQ